MDVKFTQSTDGGFTWTTPVVVNDNVDAVGVPTEQFQPSVAAGPGGAVAVAFYDRRGACPNDPSVLPANVGRTNFCIDTSLQAYKDSGSGAVPVGANVRISEFTWDPEQPGQHLGGLSQYHAPVPGTRVRRVAGSSATTSPLRSPRETSTRSWSRLTTPRTWPQTRAVPSTTSSRR